MKQAYYSYNGGFDSSNVGYQSVGLLKLLCNPSDRGNVLGVVTRPRTTHQMMTDPAKKIQARAKISLGNQFWAKIGFNPHSFCQA